MSLPSSSTFLLCCFIPPCFTWKHCMYRYVIDSKVPWYEEVCFRWTSYLNWLVFPIDLWEENLILNWTSRNCRSLSFAHPWSIVLKWPAVCCIVFTSLPLRASTPYLTAYITTASHWKRLHRQLVAVHYNLRIRKPEQWRSRWMYMEHEAVTLITKRLHMFRRGLEWCILVLFDVRTKD